MNLHQLTDEKLMVMYQEGDDLAFQVLYARHSGRIFSYVRSKIPNMELAGDVFQEIFIKIHKSKSLYNPAYEVLPWIFTVTRNIVIDSLRKTRKDSLMDSFDSEFGERIASPLLEEAVSYGDLAPALARLPEPQKAAVEMRYMKEKTFEEIAERLNTSSENVRQLVSRGVRNLKKIFRDGEGA